MTGLAKAEWSSEAYDLISFGFPGLYYPGLLTLGPSLHLYAQLSGEVSLYGQLSTSVGYTFPVRYHVHETYARTDDVLLRLEHQLCHRIEDRRTYFGFRPHRFDRQ